MCGRYQFSLHDHEDLRRILHQAQKRSSAFRELEFPVADPIADPVCGAVADIAPTNVAPVMIARGGTVTAEFQQWGLPNWQGKLIINARAETVTEKPMFRRSIAARRCVVPASGYFEWDANRHKYRFRCKDSPLYLAGLYDSVDGVNHFLVLTTAPNVSVSPIHDRMPLILRREQVRPWLTDDLAAMELLTRVPPALDRECCDGQLRMEDWAKQS